MTEPVWTPSPERQRNAHMTAFLEAARQASNEPLPDYEALHGWSIRDREAFWALLWSYAGIQAHTHYDRVLINGDRMPGAQWFPGARLNFAENLLKKSGPEPALIFCDERGHREAMSWDELRRQVACVAAALRSWGVVPGDRVAGFLPNRPEAVVAMLATTSLGAVWSSCSPDFGVNGVIDRFGQIEPKVLFVADGYFYAGKTINSLPRIKQITDQLPTLGATVCVSYVAERADVGSLPNAYHFGDLLRANHELHFQALPFDHPLYILYSSGTTGVPKCIVHSAGGTLVQHLKEHLLHADLRDGQRIFYFTTCGWMMWNWLVSALASGATLVLFDGSPFHPDPGVLWRMAAAERVSIFGTSARYLLALEKAGFNPGENVSLPDLRTVLSTGSPLAHESYDFVYRAIKQDLQLSSVAGGTDIIACFVIGNPILPVYRGEIQCRALGMKTEIFDEQGNAVECEKGELVCTAAFPSMPIGFFNDPDNTRYRAAYFERFENVWCHGDYAELTEHKGVIIYGRSDAVLNPGGVRIGTAEIYRIVEKFEQVAESVVIGQQWQDDVRVVLFLRMQPGIQLDDPLRKEIREAIRTGASPRHMPARIIDVPDIPRTISGKIVELAVRDCVHGQTVKNTDALANPDALEHFRDRPELGDVTTLLERYRAHVLSHGFTEDPAQLRAIAALQQLATALCRRRNSAGLREKFTRLLRGVTDQPAKGVYLWGGVGRGKTFIMDLFFESLPFEDKQRLHFHRFMNSIHAQLNAQQKQRNPIELVADTVSSRYRIICFDEFFVSDIADAMLLGNLFRALFQRGVSLVATSNVPPSQLYRDGLQRAQFLPAIALLEQHTRVLHMDGDTDYRLRVLEKADLYLTPIGQQADARLAQFFVAIAPDEGNAQVSVEVLGRPIAARRAADGVIWFDFPQLCDGPRSQADYIELSRCYQTVLISNLPRFDAALENQARRFIALVDEFYDHRVKLMVSAAVPMTDLYAGRKLGFEFQRTTSRLQEMQSHDYLASRHIP